MIMKKLFIVLFFNNLFFHTLISQTLIQQIDDVYSSLDSAAYIEDLIISFRVAMERERKEMDDGILELRGIDYHGIDSIQRQQIIDDILGKTMYSKTWLEDRANIFISAVKDNKPVYYVLNLRADSCNQSYIHLCLLPDTIRLPFNLFYFGKKYKDGFYIYCEGGQYSWQDSGYRTFSRKLGKNAPKVFKKILRKKPKYLLYCYELEGMNTILYVLNDEIYVYRIMQMKKYKLDDYVEKFLLSKNDISDKRR